MKLNKILAIALAAVTMTACSDDDKSNTASDVFVSLGQATVEAPEDFTGSYSYVPVVLTGEANGPVKVVLEVEETSENPAIESAHYIVTSKTLNIPAGVTEVNVEFHATGDTDINEDRQFAIVIKSVEGAQVQGNDRTVVTLLDDDHYLPEAYAKVQGDYIFKATDSNGSSVANQWSITGVAEGEEGYLSKLRITGFLGEADWGVDGTLLFNATTKLATVNTGYGQWIAKTVGFQGLGNCDIMLASVADGYLVDSGNTVLEADANYTGLAFPAGTAWIGALFASADGSFTGYTCFWWEDMSLTKVQ